MSHIVMIRTYKPGDELFCQKLAKDGIMSSMNPTSFGIMFKELSFQLMILFAAIMFIFFGVPLTVCISVIPLVICLMYIGTYVGFITQIMGIYEEISNIPRHYMSNAFSCFWVAEVYEPRFMVQPPKDFNYTIMTEEEFHNAKINVTYLAKKLVGIIGLSKSHSLDRGAWIKRLCVDEQYRKKGIGSRLLQTAMNFATEQGYTCANIVASEYTEGGKELCLKMGFEICQMYNRNMLGSIITILMYELTYQIKSSKNDYMPVMNSDSFLEQHN